jgi:signal transduction histidine kinase
VERRIVAIADDADLTAVGEALRQRRSSILEAWLRAARSQPFHVEHPDRAVTDDIPLLFDAVVELIARTAPTNVDVEPPLDDDRVARAARAHAQARFEQRLGPVAIATEFRLLRQEISRALVAQIDEAASPADVIGALAFVNDALDGANTLALSTLTDRLETVREEFLASTLHDVRQPITLVEASVALGLRWVRRDPLDRDRLADALEGALYATQELSLLIDTLSDASRVAMGAVDLDLEPVRAASVIRDAIEFLEPRSRDRVHVEPVAIDAIGEWDRRAVRRILTNVLTNALKYSPDDRPVHLSVAVSAGVIAIEVVDQGIGLMPEEMALLFRRYGRTDDARARGLPGIGLGLYASQGLARAHGGQIVLESDGRDRGTRARIELPLADAILSHLADDGDDLSEAAQG